MSLFKSNIILLIASCLIITIQSCNPAKAPQKETPNVIIFLSDDQGWGDMGINGNDLIRTPVLDQMAGNGASFDRFYVSPLCAPTRASLLTGKYFLRTGTSWVSKGLENMNTDEVTFAEIFKDAGYATGCFGKWHNGAHYPQNAIGQGFDEFLGFSAGHWSNYFNTSLEHNGKMVKTSGYITDVLTDAALEFIDKNKDQPFLCYVPYNVPHSPHQVPDQYFNYYKNAGLDDELAAIYGMVENMDFNIGRVQDKLKELGLEENTIVIFLSDNGPNGHRYNGGMKGIKGSVHEGGVRVPFYIKWLGKIQAGTKVESMGAHIDLLPTLADLCNIQLPENLPIDGKSLKPEILGEKTSTDRVLFEVTSREVIQPSPGAVRTRQYRMVVENKDTLLYDLDKDPEQHQDISHEHPELVAEYAANYNKWYNQVKPENQEPSSIPLGYSEAPEVTLPAYEAKFTGKIKFEEGHGWAHDWLKNWVSTSDSIFWEIEVAEAGEYEVILLYTCPQKNTGLP